MASQRLWGIRPIFITSTFRDMHAERDHLRNVVFPELEDRLKQRRHHLEPIDLRWGVETVDEGEEHAREMLVLKVCLAEVERSRPFLIGLIGDRYGWIPPAERMQAAAHEAGFNGEVVDKSVTDLEVDFGVFSQPEQKRRCFFYFRKALPYDDMPAEIAADYRETDQASIEKLQHLKDRITKELPDRVRDYSAQWDKTSNTVTGLAVWGRQVLGDIWAELDQETKAFADQGEPSWQEQERFALEQFIEDRARGFIGRTESLDKAIELAASANKEQQSWGLCITGEPGAGKSAFFSRLYQQLQEQNILVLAHAAGISPQSTQVDQMLRRWIDELAQALNINALIPEDAKPDDIEQIFQSLLGRTSARQRVVVLIDALNQFESTTRAQYLTWLPKRWPDNARLITTAISGSQSEALNKHEGVEEHTLPLLSNTEANDIIKSICQRYHRTLNPRVLDVLLTKQTKEQQPAAGNPLWLQMAVEEMNLLDADDFARAEKIFTGKPEEKLHQLLMATAEELPPTVTDLYGWMLERAEQLHGKEYTRAFVNLIAISRSGWREKDFESLIPTLANQVWDNLQFAALRRTFRSHITQKGAEAQWDFSHAQMRIAIEARNLTNEQTTKQWHTRLSDYLLNLSEEDGLHASETMFHLYQADDKQRAAQYYGSELTESEQQGATRVLAAEILASEAHCPNPGLDWVCALSQLVGLDNKVRYGVSYHYMSDLNDALLNIARLDTCWPLQQMAGRILTELTESDPGNAAWQRELSVSHSMIGDVLSAQGDLAGARASYWASLEIAERLAESDPSNVTWQRDLSVNHIKMCGVLSVQGDLGGAETSCRASLEIAERLVESDPGNAVLQRNLSVSHNNMGDVLSAQGDLGGAEASYRASLEIAERLAESDPGDIKWQRELSVSHERIGNVLSAQGDLGGAGASYRASLDIRERLAESDPGNATWQRDLSVSHNKMGDVLSAQGDLGRAGSSYRASLEIAERLTESDPGNVTWQRDLSMSHIKMGDVLSAQGDLGGAGSSYQESLEIAERLTESDPGNAEWQRDLVVSHERMGNVLSAQGDLAGAGSSYRASLEIAERLAESDPGNAEWQRDLSASHDNIGNVLNAQGDIDGAGSSYRASLEIVERLAESAPGNAEWQRDLSASHDNIGNVLNAQGDIGGAGASYRVSLEIRERLAESAPGNAEWQRDLVVSFCNLAYLCQENEEQSQADQYWGRCYETLRGMKQAGITLDPPLEDLLEQLDAAIE